MRHLIVAERADDFFGWPANNGIWSWGDEVVVGYQAGPYQPKDKGHSIDFGAPPRMFQSRSRDGGLTWSEEGPFDFGKGDPARPGSAIDFMEPDLAIRCADGTYRVSHDRCRTWSGPLPFAGLPFESMSSRTDYQALGEKDCLFFLSAQDPDFGIKAGSYTDRALCARTRDGGLSFEFQGWMLPLPPATRSVMPATVRRPDGSLASALRRRLDEDRDGLSLRRCWIDVVESRDQGRTWEFLAEAAATADPPPSDPRNGNPPAMALLPDGRLCLVYGYRSAPFGMRYKTSPDGGRTWGPERILRTDSRTWDFGYPRTVVLPGGSVLAIYYYTTEEIPNQHIAATIFDPE